MNCRFVSEQLSAYLDDELEAGLASELKEHLDACETCRKEFESLRELTRTLHALPRRPAPEDMQREVTSRIERALLLGKPAARRGVVVLRRVFGGAALAAAVTLLALGVYVKFFPAESPPSAPGVLDHEAFRSEADKTLARVPDAARKPAELAGKEGALEEKLDRKLAFGEGEAAARMGGGAGGRVEPLPTTTKGAEAKETPGALEVAPATPTPAKTVPAPEAPSQLVLEPTRTARSDLDTRPAEPMAQPPVTEALRDDVLARTAKPDAEKPAEPDGKKPAGPEVLNLVVAAEDFDAAKKHIVSVADSLKIRTVSDLSYLAAALRQVDMDEVKAGKVNAPAAGGEAGETLPRTEDTDNTRRGAQRIDQGRPVLVLAVEEEKLPQFVAKLAARRVTGSVERYRTFYSNEGERAKKTGLRAEQGTPAAVTAGKPGEKNQETRDLARKDVHGLSARTLPATPAPADTGKRLTEDPLKQKREELLRLVYIRVFLTHPEPAAETKPAKESPATKP
jgi:hypothetical protein